MGLRLLCAALVIAIVSIAACSSSDNEPDKGRSKSADAAASDDGQAKLAEMLAVLKPSDTEAERLRAAFASRERSLTEWSSQHGDELAELEREMAAAASDRNLAEVEKFIAHYNFVWKPATLKGITPAMAAGVTGRLWKFEDLFDAVRGG